MPQGQYPAVAFAAAAATAAAAAATVNRTGDVSDHSITNMLAMQCGGLWAWLVQPELCIWGTAEI